jgi:hypothetical protein
MTGRAKSEETETRPTGTNSRQDAEIAQLKGQIEALMKLIPATTAPAAKFTVTGEVPADVTRAQVEEAKTEPTTYIALEDGTDLKQGFIKAGTRFTTTQPPAEWMQPVDDDEAQEDE